MKPIKSDNRATLTKIAGMGKDNIPDHLVVRGRRVGFPGRPLVMGILNINDDSFSGDGSLDQRLALERAAGMVRAGADIIDVGGESARTNREPVTPEEEIRRVRPFLERVSAAVAEAEPRGPDQVFPPLVSLNTWRPEVVEGCLGAGFDLLNDMGALPDATNARLCASIGAALLVMHSRGLPKVAHRHVTYPDVMEELLDFFAEKTALAIGAGIDPQGIVLDPGIDFAKQVDDNLRILRELDRIAALGHPVLVPVSRKSVIGRVLGIPDARRRDAGTVACIVASTLRGASILRVHNIDAAWFAVRAATMLR
jgi:dihydropteroate synthase